jgi:hypothetical protein
MIDLLIDPEDTKNYYMDFNIENVEKEEVKIR